LRSSWRKLRVAKLNNRRKKGPRRGKSVAGRGDPPRPSREAATGHTWLARGVTVAESGLSHLASLARHTQSQKPRRHQPHRGNGSPNPRNRLTTDHDAAGVLNVTGCSRGSPRGKRRSGTWRHDSARQPVGHIAATWSDTRPPPACHGGRRCGFTPRRFRGSAPVVGTPACFSRPP
jgi:hypothetical protein